MAEKVKFVIEVDNKGAIISMKKLESSTKGTTDKMSKNFLSLSNVIKGSVILAIGATIIKMQELAKSSITLASDLEETQGKFDVVFRGMTKTAEQWSKNLQNSYAMAETESKKYLSSVQDLLVPTGMLRTEAGNLSMEFVKMAADLGSFNNLPTEQVIRDIQSALQGGSETMAKYGVNVKAAKVEQEILNKGWVKSKKDITDAHKAQAIYNIIMRDGSDAIGDMDRTSGSYANQLKKLKANINDLTTAVGVELLPKLTELITEMNNWIKQNDELIKQKIPEHVDKIKNAIEALFVLYDRMPSDAFEFGLIGFMLLGRKGAAIGIALSAVKDYAIDAADAIRFIQEGLMDFDETTGSLEKFYKALERARMFEKYNQRDRSQLPPGANGNGYDTLTITKNFSDIYQKEAEVRIEWNEKARQALWEQETAITKMYEYEAKQRVFINKHNLDQLIEDAIAANQELNDKYASIADANMMLGEDMASTMRDSIKDMVKSVGDGSDSMKDILINMMERLQDAFLDHTLKMLEIEMFGGGEGGDMGGFLGKLFSGASSLFGGGNMASPGSVFSAPQIGGAGTPVGFADGGIVTGPTNALIGEGQYNEAVVPLPDGRSIPIEGGGGGSTNIFIQAMDSQSFLQFAKRNPEAFVTVINDQVNRGNSQLSTAISKANRLR